MSTTFGAMAPGSTELLYRANYIPGYKDRFEDKEGWKEFSLPDGSVSWQHTNGAFAGVRRMPNGLYISFALGE